MSAGRAPQVWLVDNGSLEPAAIRGHRALAESLGARLNRPVVPVSVLHSDRVPADLIDGRPAEILEPTLRRRLAAGETDFVVLPLFVGPSRAVSEYIPQTGATLRRTYPALRLQVAAPLHAPADDRLARILEAQVMTALAEARPASGGARVAVVDHGSPARAVAEARDRIAAQLAARLDGRAAGVAACSMERRPGAEYAFNEPLLANLLASPPWNAGDVVVAQLFLLPGRHAGPGGDIAGICAAAERASGGRLRTVRAGLLAEHPLLVDILADRFAAVMRQD